MAKACGTFAPKAIAPEVIAPKVIAPEVIAPKVIAPEVIAPIGGEPSIQRASRELALMASIPPR